MGKKVTSKSDKAVPTKQQYRRSTTIEKAANGFVVRGYRNDWVNEKLYVAKTKTDAQKLASKLLGGK